MHAPLDGKASPLEPRTTVERVFDRDVVVTRTINGPAHLVFAAFTQAELFRQWWVPKSMGMTLLSCEMDVRVGGMYRLTFDVGGAEPLAFFGTYTDVQPFTRLSWTNEEGGPDGSVTTVTFEAAGSTTLVVLSERYASKEALDAAGLGAAEVLAETFGQLDALLDELR
jgi:uncharacterized protein YndB with AHSA1/START domain